MTTVTAAAAAAVIAVVATVTVQRATDGSPGPEQRVTAQTQLDALPAAPAGAHGSARLLVAGDGRRLHVHADGIPAPGQGFYEVWLIDSTSLKDPAGLRMVAVGNLGDGRDDSFPVPASVDLGRYNLVDISAEPVDGNERHSGNSLLRGTLNS